MTLAELIAALEVEDPAKVVPDGFTNPHSYRGYYEQLAFEPTRDVAVGAMLADARSALGATYQGYKGGDYEMTGDTDCWVAFWGACGEELGPTLLRLMLAAGSVPGEMPDTTRRVIVTLTLVTDAPETGILADITKMLAEEGAPLTDARVDAFDLDADDEPEPEVQLVFRDGGLYSVHVDDPESAGERARTVGGVVVELPVVADYRARSQTVTSTTGIGRVIDATGGAPEDSR